MLFWCVTNANLTKYDVCYSHVSTRHLDSDMEEPIMKQEESTGKRKQLPRALLVAAIVLLLAGIAYAAPIVINDDAGPDDFSGQKDLTQLSVDYAGLPNTLAVKWNWDDTAWTGANTGDACSLYDTDGDGLANYALCATVAGTPATWVATRLYSCGDTAADRCTQPNALVPSPGSTCSAGVVPGSDPFGGVASHNTGNTCSATTGCYTDDTVASCTVQMSDFGANEAFLINVCSYPSAIPNSDPSECVVTPNDAYITIYKVAENTSGVSTGYCPGRGSSSAPQVSPTSC